MEEKPRRRALGSIALAVGLTLGCVATVATVGAAGAADTPTPHEIVVGVKRAATRPGKVLHTVTTTSSKDVDASTESWIDVLNDRVRQQSTNAARPSPSAALVADGRFRSFSPSGDHVLEDGLCPVSGLTASLIDLCTRSSDASEQRQLDRTVTAARHAGHHAWELTTAGTSKTNEFDIHSFGRTWFDQRTALPLANETTSTVTHRKQTQREHLQVDETSEFVAADSLPADFFSPESVDAWLKAQPGGTEVFDPRELERNLAPLRSGVASDGTEWTLSAGDLSGACYVSISTGSGRGVSTCDSDPDPGHLSTMTNQAVGQPAVAVLTAPRGSKVVEVVARHGKHGSDVHLLNSDPIKGPTGVAFFVVELPDGAHNVRSTRVIR